MNISQLKLRSEKFDDDDDDDDDDNNNNNNNNNNNRTEDDLLEIIQNALFLISTAKILHAKNIPVYM